MILIALKTLSISIIIPVRNEEATIGPCLDHLTGLNGLEILVVDGGSSDSTVTEVKKRKVELITSAPGRGVQQHTGALAATGNILLFLHADTRLPRGFSSQVTSLLSKNTVVAGAFHLAIDAEAMKFRLVEWGANLRSKLFNMPYGDQALFMKKTTYFSAGGFPEQPIMEDVALINILKTTGRVMLADSAVITSARRWNKKGVIQTTLFNQLMLAGSKMGISPDRLALWYYGKR